MQHNAEKVCQLDIVPSSLIPHTDHRQPVESDTEDGHQKHLFRFHGGLEQIQVNKNIQYSTENEKMVRNTALCMNRASCNGMPQMSKVATNLVGPSGLRLSQQ